VREGFKSQIMCDPQVRTAVRPALPSSHAVAARQVVSGWVLGRVRHTRTPPILCCSACSSAPSSWSSLPAHHAQPSTHLCCSACSSTPFSWSRIPYARRSTSSTATTGSRSGWRKAGTARDINWVVCACECVCVHVSVCVCMRACLCLGGSNMWGGEA